MDNYSITCERQNDIHVVIQVSNQENQTNITESEFLLRPHVLFPLLHVLFTIITYRRHTVGSC